jgi:hypothetical protein
MTESVSQGLSPCLVWEYSIKCMSGFEMTQLVEYVNDGTFVPLEHSNLE